MTVLSSIYAQANSGLLAVDLLRRDPSGLAPRLAAGACQIARSGRRYQDEATPSTVTQGPDAESEAARLRAFDASFDVVLTAMTVEQAYAMPDEHKLIATLGGARDAWKAIRGFGATSPLHAEILVLADAVLALWARPYIDVEDFVVLTAPADLFVRIAHRGRAAYRFDYGEHADYIHGLLAHIEAMTPKDFTRLDDGAAGSEEWEAAHAEAATAIEQAGDDTLLMKHTLTNLAAIGMLGAVAHRLRVERGYEVVAATSLTGAVSAVIAMDIIGAQAYDVLVSDWREAG